MVVYALCVINESFLLKEGVQIISWPLPLSPSVWNILTMTFSFSIMTHYCLPLDKLGHLLVIGKNVRLCVMVTSSKVKRGCYVSYLRDEPSTHCVEKIS